jgi:hypothetical protein
LEFKDIRALESVLTTLEPLTRDERVRVLRWTVEKLGIEDFGHSLSTALRRDLKGLKPIDAAFSKHPNGFQSIANFVSAANPQTDSDRVLCAATYLQDFADGDSSELTLTGKQINDALKDLGHGVKNITDCINTLRERKPQHMIQTKKSGKARQSWKEYRVTGAGVDYAYRLINEVSVESET